MFGLRRPFVLDGAVRAAHQGTLMVELDQSDESGTMNENCD